MVKSIEGDSIVRPSALLAHSHHLKNLKARLSKLRKVLGHVKRAALILFAVSLDRRADFVFQLHYYPFLWSFWINDVTNSEHTLVDRLTVRISKSQLSCSYFIYASLM